MTVLGIDPGLVGGLAAIELTALSGCQFMARRRRRHCRPRRRQKHHSQQPLNIRGAGASRNRGTPKKRCRCATASPFILRLLREKKS
jgi:hypothetical protein